MIDYDTRIQILSAKRRARNNQERTQYTIVMELVSLTRTYYLEDCTIEGYKGYFHQWEIKIEGAKSYDVLKLCQDYCRKEKFTKKQFLSNLEYSLKQCEDSYRSMFITRSFYELERREDGTWIYTWRRIPQNFV